MLNSSNYNDPKLDSETRSQLFKLFVEDELRGLKQELIKINNKLQSYDTFFTNANTRLTNLEEKAKSKPLDKPLDYSFILNTFDSRLSKLEKTAVH